MKAYKIDEKTLNEILEMLDGYCTDAECIKFSGYSTPVYFDFEIKDLINKLKELKNETNQN